MSSEHPSIDIFINAQAVRLTNQQPCVQTALDYWGAKPPFAVAVNTQFVPRAQYQSHPLQPGDKIDIISPVTGG